MVTIFTYCNYSSWLWLIIFSFFQLHANYKLGQLSSLKIFKVQTHWPYLPSFWKVGCWASTTTGVRCRGSITAGLLAIKEHLRIQTYVCAHTNRGQKNEQKKKHKKQLKSKTANRLWKNKNYDEMLSITKKIEKLKGFFLYFLKKDHFFQRPSFIFNGPVLFFLHICRLLMPHILTMTDFSRYCKNHIPGKSCVVCSKLSHRSILINNFWGRMHWWCPCSRCFNRIEHNNVKRKKRKDKEIKVWAKSG